MIYATVDLTIDDYTTTCNKKIVLYRGDRNVEVRFVIKGNKFIVLENTYAQMIIRRPSASSLFSNPTLIENDTVLFTISGEMIDELREEGEYLFQIRLFDDNMAARATLPPCEGCLYIGSPIVSEVETLVGDSEVGNSYVMQSFADGYDIYDEDGNYIKTEWKNGDLISEDRLNKIEDALYDAHANKGSTDDIDLSDYALKTELPNKTSQLENDSNFLTEIPAEYITEDELTEATNGLIFENKDVLESITQEDIDKWNSGGGGTVTPDIDIPDEYITEDELAEGMTFTTDMLTINALGGIAANTDLNGLSIKEILNKLLYPYVAPVISVAATPNGGTYEKGNNQTITNVRVTITKKSEKIIKIEVLNGSTLLASQEDSSISNGGTYNFGLNIPVNSVNVQLTVRVTDNSNKVVSANTGAFTFIYPYYWGVCAESDVIDGVLVTSLAKNVVTKGNKSVTYTTNNQRMIFAYPSSYGRISKIVDPNNFDVTSTFTVLEVPVTCLDGSNQNYYVYANNASTVNNFKMTFNY